MKWSGLRCPDDREHGPLLPWVPATDAGEGWHCPHRDHDGFKDKPRTRPFFTTAQAQAATRTGVRG